jgi:hypothetical protein
LTFNQAYASILIMDNESKSPLNNPASEAHSTLLAGQELGNIPQIANTDLRQGFEAMSAIPPAQEVGSESFLQRRLSSLHSAWDKGKSVAKAAGDRFAIEHEGYRFSPTENFATRLGRFAMIRQWITDPERKPVDITDVAANPVAQRVLARQRNRERLQTRSRHENFGDTSKLDLARLGAYELLTAAVVRHMGTMMIHGAAQVGVRVAERRPDNNSKPAKVVRAIEKKTGYWSDIEEGGLHNPTVRRLNGHTRKSLKQAHKQAGSHQPKRGSWAEA